MMGNGSSGDGVKGNGLTFRELIEEGVSLWYVLGQETKKSSKVKKGCDILQDPLKSESKEVVYKLVKVISQRDFKPAEGYCIIPESRAELHPYIVDRKPSFIFDVTGFRGQCYGGADLQPISRNAKECIEIMQNKSEGKKGCERELGVRLLYEDKEMYVVSQGGKVFNLKMRKDKRFIGAFLFQISIVEDEDKLRRMYS